MKTVVVYNLEAKKGNLHHKHRLYLPKLPHRAESVDILKLTLTASLLMSQQEKKNTLQHHPSPPQQVAPAAIICRSVQT